MALPKGYKRLEYIQSSGTQWFDTEFMPNQDSSVIVDIAFDNSEDTQAVYGARTSTSSKTFCVFWMTADYFRLHYYNGYSNFTAGPDNPTVRYTIKHEKNVLTIGENTLSRTYTSFQTEYNMLLLAVNQAGAASFPASAKLYGCQIYDSGTIVRDFVPCINPDGEYGLYDRVNTKFYGNAGTGTFAVGPVVPESVDESEITELEYIQSSGAQYVDTTFVPNQNSRVVLDGYNDSASSGWTYGTWESATSKQFAGSCNKSYAARYGSANATLTENIPVGPVHFDQNKNTYNVNGSSGSFAAQTFSCEYSIYLFAINAAGSVSSGKFTGKIYSCQIYDNGLLERDYIPAMLVNGEVGLYDRANGEFYRNAGSGEFVAGPEAIETPATPKNFQMCECAKPNVVLEWDAVENAAGYNLYRDGELLASVLDTTYTDTPPASGSFVYTLEAYNDAGISESVSVGVVVDFCPEMPSGFCVTSQDSSCVCLSWDAVSCEKYCLYRDGVLLAEVSGTEYEDTGVQANRAYTYSLAAVDSYGVSPVAFAMARTVEPVTPMLGLITDRTILDHQHWAELRDKGFGNMTEEEQAEWSGASMKGSYGMNDLNRVGTALNYVRDRLTAAGYLAGNEFEARVDWVLGEIPETGTLTYYLGAVAIIREAFTRWRSTPDTPADVGSLSYQDANDIEQILIDVDQLITNMLAARYYSGELFCGEV